MLIITLVLTLGICIGWLRFRIDDSTDLCKSVGPGTEDPWMGTSRNPEPCQAAIWLHN